MKTGIIATILALLLMITFVSANEAPVLTVSSCATSAVEDNSYTCTVTATDADIGDVLTFSWPTKPEGATISSTSSTSTITWTPDEEQIGSNTVTVKVTDDDATPLSDEETFTIFVRPESVCGDYTSVSDISNIRISDLIIESDNDDEDDFYPGDTINIEVDVENEDNNEINDVIVEALLYDTTEGVRLDRAESKDFDLDDYDEHTVKLTLEVPKGIDAGNDIILFISVYEDGNDDENCDWESDDGLNIKRRTHDIAINEVTLTPETVKAGKNVEIRIDLENVGDRDEEGAYIRIKNDELKIDKKLEKFDIESYEKGDDDEYTVITTLAIPANAEAGEYNLEIYAYDENNDICESGEAFVALTVEGTTTATPVSTATATISTEGAPAEIEQGKSFNIPVKLTNTASEAKEYKITVTNIGDWADSTSAFDAYLTAGQSSTYYVAIMTKKEAAEGTHSATLLVKEGSTTIATKTLSFTIPEAEKPAVTGGTVAEINTEEKPVFQSLFKGTTLWIIGDLVLVIVAIVLLKMLFSKKEEK